jgi:Cu(I)/Ag(I) efflux system membrane fusion protein/cobalt-zinc-cadmium efflux system membrane fusion protein
MNRTIGLVVISLALAMGIVAVSCSHKENGTTSTGTETAAGIKYHCPMHPSIVSDKPGNCPICSMRLVPFDSQAKGNEPGAKTAVTKTMYHSTMNPNEVSDKPGKDSMGMDMVPFQLEESAEKTPSGLAAVSITADARQRMGLTTGVVERRALAREVRTSARIVADETRLYRVTVKVDGWVDKLFAATTGQFVKQGDPLLTVYSPDLLTLQNEYLTALRSGSSNLVASARRRLSLWDISEEQIDRLDKTGVAEKTLTLFAPASGWIIERMVLPGQKIAAGESLLVIADLSTVWADADIYQSDLPYVKVGMPVELTLSSWLDKKFEGKVTFVSPTLDPESRTMKARLEIPNSELLLKPEMFATATLSYELGEGLAIPETAVMRTGLETYAFRDAGDGRLVPTPIVVGERSDGYYQLLSGLNAGDKVVTSANFLVDSESSMKAAMESMAASSRQP